MEASAHLTPTASCCTCTGVRRRRTSPKSTLCGATPTFYHPPPLPHYRRPFTPTRLSLSSAQPLEPPGMTSLFLRYTDRGADRLVRAVRDRGGMLAIAGGWAWGRMVTSNVSADGLIIHPLSIHCLWCMQSQRSPPCPLHAAGGIRPLLDHTLLHHWHPNDDARLPVRDPSNV